MNSATNKDFPIIISWSPEDEVFIAFAPHLDNCIAHGEAREGAAKNLSVVIDDWLEAAKELGWEIPEPSHILPV